MMNKQHQPLSLLLLHLLLQCSTHVLRTEAFSCNHNHSHKRQCQTNKARTVSTRSTSQQRTSCTSINYSSTSTFNSPSTCTTTTTTTNIIQNNVKVSIINSNQDVLSLADMRYQEWMANDPNPPSIHNFRLATMEIHQERCMDGAMVFLAKKRRNDHDGDSNSNYYNDYEDASVGAAELSPIELKDVIVHSDNIIDNSNLLRYVTDVVTSSSSRRLGVGSSLMSAIEKSAWDMGTRCLLLHVEEDNVMARRFYEKLNYVYVDDVNSSSVGGGVAPLNLEATVGQTIHIDTSRLAMNAGTTGQLLMMKELSEPVLEEVEEKRVKDASKEVIKGFGMKKLKRVKKKKRA